MGRFLVFAALSLVLAPCGRAATGAVREFTIPTTNANPLMIVTGSDGNLWFTEGSADKVGRINTAGVVTDFAVPVPDFPVGQERHPDGIALGADGNLWFTETFANAIGRITAAGAVTQYQLPRYNTEPAGIAAGIDGNLWFTEFSGGAIGRITPGAAITEFNGPLWWPNWITSAADGKLWFNEPGYLDSSTTTGTLTRSTLYGCCNALAPGPDGNLWFTSTDQIGRRAADGTIKWFTIPTQSSDPFGITTGSDGNLWFTEESANKIGRITPTGTITEFSVPTASAQPFGIAPGPDGNLWFTESTTGKIGRVQIAKPKTRYVLSTDAAFIPQTRTSVQGYAVQWTFEGPRVHEVQDASGMGLFDSGSKPIVSNFSYTFTATGTYAYRDPLNPTLTGKIGVPLLASPSSGSVTTPFTVTWATGVPASGFVYDVQIKRPGSTSYVPWQSGVTVPSATFTPDAGSGTYSVRARLRKTATGKASGWSAGKTITAS